MWLLNHFFAPNLPVRQRYYHIEAVHKIALYEWLIAWAELVESNYDDFYSCYPFARRTHPDPVSITLRAARKTLVALLIEPDVASTLPVLDYEITKLANAIADWRGKPARQVWEMSGFFELIDLTKYEP